VFWDSGLGFGVWGLGFRVWDLGFGVLGFGFRVWGLWFRVWGLGVGVWGFEYAVLVSGDWCLRIGARGSLFGFMRFGFPPQYTWAHQYVRASTLNPIPFCPYSDSPRE
jgi:hypothetical protein